MNKFSRRSFLKASAITSLGLLINPKPDFAQTVTNNSSDLVYNKRFDPNNLPTRRVISESEAFELFGKLNKNIRPKLIYKKRGKVAHLKKTTVKGYMLPHNFAQTECQMRSHLMCREIMKYGIRPMKVFLIASEMRSYIPGTKIIHPFSFNWGMHTAPTIDVKRMNNNVVTMIFDPTSQIRPVSLKQWHDDFSPFKDVRTVPKGSLKWEFNFVDKIDAKSKDCQLIREDIYTYSKRIFKGKVNVQMDGNLDFIGAYNDLRENLDSVADSMEAFACGKGLPDYDDDIKIGLGLDFLKNNVRKPKWLKPKKPCSQTS